MKPPLTVAIKINKFFLFRDVIKITARQASNVAYVGFNQLKQVAKVQSSEETPSRFPTFTTLNVQTEDRVHKFSVECDKVIKFIKLGAVNKPIALQYCHYLAELARASQNDQYYYSKRCADVMSYLMRNYKDMPVSAKCQLLADVCSTSEDNCKFVIGNYINDSLLAKFAAPMCTELISSCYKFQLWDSAQSLICTEVRNSLINVHSIKSMIDSIIIAAGTYASFESDFEGKKKLRSKIIRHLSRVIEICRARRVQFVTNRRQDLTKALQSLDILVHVNPTIKMSGRCTSCDSVLPLFENDKTKVINAAIAKQIMKGSDKGIYLNAAPNDCRRFESFLNDIHAIDKKPVDCVVDGLNIAYKNTHDFRFYKKTLNEGAQKTFKLQNPEEQARILMNILIRGNFLYNYKKILVVGKYHMKKWPGLLEFFHKHNIHFFPSYNDSKDDLFQLYAATLNHKSILVTNDFLRDHLAQLDGVDRILLERWIDTHQAWIEMRSLKPILPTPYEKIASIDEKKGLFHLPVIDEGMLDEVGNIEPPPHLNSKMLTWLCCKFANGYE